MSAEAEARLMAQVIGRLEALERRSPGVEDQPPWVPILAQGPSTNIAATINWAHYSIIGSWVLADFYLQPTGTGTANNAITVSVPLPIFNVAGLSGSVGIGWIYTGSFWGSHWRMDNGAIGDRVSCWSHKDHTTQDSTAIGNAGSAMALAVGAAGWHIQGTLQYRWR